MKYHNLFLLNLVSREQYASYRNKVTSLIKKYKQQFYKEIFSKNFGNMKKTWGTIKELCKSNEKHTIRKIYHNGAFLMNSSEIASIFNSYFVTIANDLAGALPQSNISPYLYLRSNTFPPIEQTPVSPGEVSNIIQSMKVTKTGVNEVSVNLFKKFHMFFFNMFM